MIQTSGGGDDDGRAQPPIVNLASAIFIALAAVFALVWLIPVHTNASAASYDVSPAFIPKVSAWAVLILSLGQIFISLRKFKAAGYIRDGQWNVITEPLAWIVICTAIYFATTRLGFLVAGPLTLVACLYAAGQRSWIIIAAIAILFPLAIDFATWQLFTVDLP